MSDGIPGAISRAKSDAEPYVVQLVVMLLLLLPITTVVDKLNSVSGVDVVTVALIAGYSCGVIISFTWFEVCRPVAKGGDLDVQDVD